MKIALLTAFNEKYAPIADVTLPLMKAYVDRHGYGMEVSKYHEDPARIRSYGDRGKIELYLAHYREHDMLMWLDIDVLILNHDIEIEDVLGNRNFLWTYDSSGPCSGFWIARTVPAVTIMLNRVREEAPRNGRVIASELRDPHRVNVQFEPYGTSDQMQMRALMTIPPFDRVLGGENCVSCKQAGHCFDHEILHMPDYYDYISKYEPGDWLYTVPSIPIERRRFALLRKAQEVFHDRMGLPGWPTDADSAAGEPSAANA